MFPPDDTFIIVVRRNQFPPDGPGELYNYFEQLCDLDNDAVPGGDQESTACLFRWRGSLMFKDLQGRKKIYGRMVETYTDQLLLVIVMLPKGDAKNAKQLFYASYICKHIYILPHSQLNLIKHSIRGTY